MINFTINTQLIKLHMKKIIILLISLNVLISFAQDKLTTLENKVLNVNILEKTDRTIKYKLSNDTIQTVFITNILNFKQIEYRNGMIDLLGYQNPRKKNPLGLSLGVVYNIAGIEGGMFTGSLDYFITPQNNIEINLGTDGYYSYYSVGTKFYINKTLSTNAFAPYFGLLYGSQYGKDFLELPVGVNYITKFGLQTSLQISGLSFINSTYQSMHIELKVGWRFKD